MNNNLTDTQFSIIIVGVFVLGWLLRMIYHWEIIEKSDKEEQDGRHT